ncbi:N-acetylmuramate alpha-1-phosphate uridylyltransferase MurU [Rhodocyclaceae bacterium SMB388]
MILAAGRGERMRPLTDTCPKPLLEAGGKPLIVHQIERLATAGFIDIVINHAHLGERIETELGDGTSHGVSIRYSRETQALETAGGIRTALPLLGGDAFIVVNGDIFCDADLAALRPAAAQLRADGDLAHIVLVPNPVQHPDGDFALEDGRVRAHGAPRYTFSGIGIYHPALFSDIGIGERRPLGPLLRAAMTQDRVGGRLHDGYWLDVGTPQRLAELDARLRRQESRPNPTG